MCLRSTDSRLCMKQLFGDVTKEVQFNNVTAKYNFKTLKPSLYIRKHCSLFYFMVHYIEIMHAMSSHCSYWHNHIYIYIYMFIGMTVWARCLNTINGLRILGREIIATGSRMFLCCESYGRGPSAPHSVCRPGIPRRKVALFM